VGENIERNENREKEMIYSDIEIAERRKESNQCE
jgi:hypothetical protein